jgi:hypothetical protein
MQISVGSKAGTIDAAIDQDCNNMIIANANHIDKKAWRS